MFYGFRLLVFGEMWAFLAKLMALGMAVLVCHLVEN